nr:hypothetical protein [Escherichia coli]
MPLRTTPSVAEQEGHLMEMEATQPLRTTPSVAEQEGHLMEMEATQAP